MERMSEEEFINNVEGHITSLKNLDNKALKILVSKLEEENKNLKSDLANIQCEFGFECDECEYCKRELKKLKPNLIKEEYVINLGDYDYMILTSATPQLKIIKKNNKGISTFTVK